MFILQTKMNVACVILDEKSDIAQGMSKLRQDIESLVMGQKGERETNQMFGVYHLSKRQREGALRQTKRVCLSVNSTNKTLTIAQDLTKFSKDLPALDSSDTALVRSMNFRSVDIAHRPIGQGHQTFPHDVQDTHSGGGVRIQGSLAEHEFC